MDTVVNVIEEAKNMLIIEDDKGILTKLIISTENIEILEVSEQGLSMAQTRNLAIAMSIALG